MAGYLLGSWCHFEGLNKYLSRSGRLGEVETGARWEGGSILPSVGEDGQEETVVLIENDKLDESEREKVGWKVICL